MSKELCSDHILFVGFMGSGKTSVSRKVSSITGMSLIDVDYRIEAIEHRKVTQIFSEEGEQGFRHIETQILAGPKYERRAIIACGGGIVCNPTNRALLKSLGTIVFLDTPLEEAVGRISRPETRPLLQGGRDIKEIYEERAALYRDVADIIIESSGQSVYQIARTCVGALEERGLL